MMFYFVLLQYHVLSMGAMECANLALGLVRNGHCCAPNHHLVFPALREHSVRATSK